MAIKHTYDSLDEIPEALREDYTEVDGKFVLGVLKDFVPKTAVEDVSGLKSALHKEREAHREAERKARQIAEQYAGFDLEEYNAMKEAAAQAEEDRAKKAGEFDSLKQQMLEGFSKKEATLREENAKLTASIEKQVATAAAASALAEHKGDAKLLGLTVQQAIKVFREDDGSFVARVVDDAGNPRMGADGKYLTVSEFVAGMREDDSYSKAFLGSGSSGGGTPPGSGQPGGSGAKGGIPSDLKRSSMTPRQKADFLKEHGLEELMKLPA